MIMRACQFPTQLCPGRRLFCILLCLPLLALQNTAPTSASEYQVKAAYLLNFTKFVEWPDSAFENAASPIAICILGADPFGGALNQLVEGEVVNGRKVVIQKAKRPPAPKTCQLLYFDSSEKDLSRTLAGVGPGVLTVGEGPEFLHYGGAIAFVLENRRVRFIINNGAASAAGLTLSSRLLNVAKRVEK